jgi:hypothetical protein
MNSQRGSTLAGVLALSTIMLTAAGGLLLIEANVGNDEANAWDESRLLYGAESGIMMGARWIRVGTASDINSMAVGTLPITPEPDHWTTDDLVKVIVVVENDGTVKRLRSKATLGKDTAQITWDISSASGAAPLTLSMTNWKDTILPHL